MTEHVSKCGVNSNFGVSETVTPPVASSTSPWGMALATSMFSAATGWVIEEVARKVRKKKRR